MRRADLLGGRLDVEPGRDLLHQPQDHPEVLHVGPDGLGDARVLHLDRDLAAVVQPRAVDLADRGGGDRLLVEARRTSRRAARRARTRSPCACRRSAPSGAASRSSPSLRWNSSRYSSGTRPTSRNDSTWPSFIAAPFIVPSAVTICSAASMWRRSSAACLPCSSRVRLAACVPSWRVPWPAARRAIARGARDARGRDAVLGHRARMVSGRGRRGRRRRRRPAARRAARAGVGVGVGRSASASGSASAVARRASASASPPRVVGGRRRRRASASPPRPSLLLRRRRRTSSGRRRRRPRRRRAARTR